MNHSLSVPGASRGPVLLLASLLAFVAGSTAAWAVRSDIVPPQRRAASVELARRLATVAEPTALPAELPLPFNPPGFEKPDPDEVRPPTPTAQTAAGPAKPATDRDLLGTIAALIKPSGTILLGDDRYLLLRQKRLKVGDHLTITFEGFDYDLEISAIDSTNFTLRLNREEITRPITKSGKSP